MDLVCWVGRGLDESTRVKSLTVSARTFSGSDFPTLPRRHGSGIRSLNLYHQVEKTVAERRASYDCCWVVLQSHWIVLFGILSAGTGGGAGLAITRWDEGWIEQNKSHRCGVRLGLPRLPESSGAKSFGLLPRSSHCQRRVRRCVSFFQHWSALQYAYIIARWADLVPPVQIDPLLSYL